MDRTTTIVWERLRGAEGREAEASSCGIPRTGAGGISKVGGGSGWIWRGGKKLGECQGPTVVARRLCPVQPRHDPCVARMCRASGNVRTPLVGHVQCPGRDLPARVFNFI